MSMSYCQRVRGFKQCILIKIIHNAIKCYVPYQNPIKLHAEFNPIFRQSQYPIKWDLWLLCHFWIYIYEHVLYVYTHIGLMEGRSIGPQFTSHLLATCEAIRAIEYQIICVKKN